MIKLDIRTIIFLIGFFFVVMFAMKLVPGAIEVGQAMSKRSVEITLGVEPVE